MNGHPVSLTWTSDWPSCRRSAIIWKQGSAVVHALFGPGPVGCGAGCQPIWSFREMLTQGGAINALSQRFDAPLREAGFLAMGGQIIDATIMAAPRQRNTEAEKQDIKQGRICSDDAIQNRQF